MPFRRAPSCATGPRKALERAHDTRGSRGHMPAVPSRRQPEGEASATTSRHSPRGSARDPLDALLPHPLVVRSRRGRNSPLWNRVARRRFGDFSRCAGSGHLAVDVAILLGVLRLRSRHHSEPTRRSAMSRSPSGRYVRDGLGSTETVGGSEKSNRRTSSTSASVPSRVANDEPKQRRGPSPKGM